MSNRRYYYYYYYYDKSSLSTERTRCVRVCARAIRRLAHDVMCARRSITHNKVGNTYTACLPTYSLIAGLYYYSITIIVIIIIIYRGVQ